MSKNDTSTRTITGMSQVAGSGEVKGNVIVVTSDGLNWQIKPSQALAPNKKPDRAFSGEVKSCIDFSDGVNTAVQEAWKYAEVDPKKMKVVLSNSPK